MSNSNNSNGGVKNLLAIFENKASDQTTSPPSRGRSPNGSVTSSNSRPVSKVRTSFVAVERAGEAGGPPTLGLRKASDVIMDGQNEQVISQDEGISPGLGEILKGSPFETTSSPEKATTFTNKAPSHAAFHAPRHESHVDSPKTNGIGNKAAMMIEKMKQSDSKNPPPTTNSVTGGQPVKPLPTRQAHPKVNSPTSTKKPTTTSTSGNPIMKPQGGPAKIHAITNTIQNVQEGGKSPNSTQQPKTPTQTASARDLTKYSTQSISAEKPRVKNQETSKAPKEETTKDGPVAKPRVGVGKVHAMPNTASNTKDTKAAYELAKNDPSPTTTGSNHKFRGGPAKIQALSEMVAKGGEGNAEQESAQNDPSSTSTGPNLKFRGGPAKIQALSEMVNKAKENKEAAGNTGGSKAPDTIEKTNDTKKEKASAPKPTTISSRLPSAATAPTASSTAKTDTARPEGKPVEKKAVPRDLPRVVNSTTTSSLAKKTSRASLNTNERPKSRVSSAKSADEGFLARLTRPTASSAQKTHEKVQAISPPRARRTSGGRHEHAKKTRQSLNNTVKMTDEDEERKSNLRAEINQTLPEVSEEAKDKQPSEELTTQSQEETPLAST